MELCSLTGVCTKQQVARMVGISEREADRLLRQIASFHASEEAGGGAILEVISLEQGYWKRRGASPIVYRRGPGATAFLRDRTGQDIRPCELARPDQVVHALCIVDATLQLREMGYKVQVEQQAGLGRGSIRLDLLVETSEGLLDIEVEQSIGADHIPRIRRLLQERNRLFSSPQGRTFVRRILVLFNIPRAEWPRMQRTWRQAIATMEERPAIEVWGMLLSRFGECMNLQERSGWVNLTEPVAVDRERALSETLVKTLPDTLRRAADLLGDRIILTAFLQDFQEQAERSVDDFLSFARLIEGIAAPLALGTHRRAYWSGNASGQPLSAAALPGDVSSVAPNTQAADAGRCRTQPLECGHDHHSHPGNCPRLPGILRPLPRSRPGCASSPARL